MKTQNQLRNLSLSAVFLALSYVLPFLTGQIPEIGSMLCPMHIPVLLCGYVCGPYFGMVVGFIAPLLRTFTMGVPVLFPTAFSMAFELATYGFVSGIIYRVFPKKKGYIYCSLLISMVAGRLVRGVVQFLCMGFGDTEFIFSDFWTGVIMYSLPGVVIQIVLIPLLVIALEKAKFIADKDKNRIN